MKQETLEKLYTIVNSENVLVDEPLDKHTTFRIGGKADVLVDVAVDEIAPIIKLCNEENIGYTILGNGSNVLVGDKGIRGITLLIAKRAAEIKLDGNTITVQAGALLSKTANTALEAGLAGMEFAAGIPGSIGGAVLMNAGAYGGEMKDIIISAQVLTPDGEVKNYSNADLELAYRHSRIMDEGGIVLSAVIELQPGDKEEIRAKIKDFNGRRADKQPLNFPSAGSTFKRPEGYFAGKLIQDAGLRGYQVGGAQVSEKHCGFVVNVGGATAADITQLMKDVSDKVYEDASVRLEPEVRFIGEF